MIVPKRSAKCAGAICQPRHANHGRSQVVDGKRDEPERDSRIAVDEAGEQDQERAGSCSRCEPAQHAAAVGILTTKDRREDKLDEPAEKVGDAEEQGVASERPWDRQSDAEHRRG